ncbi:MAG: acyl-CoA dehydrogenase [Gammaproteobacteria bacterium]|nr:MAG: acyl-CoA dehydrogenase [Gammaproteobacteria bacterium]
MILFLATAALLAVRESRSLEWGAVFGLLGAMGLASGAPPPIAPLLLVLSAAAFLLSVPPVRRTLLVRPLYRGFHRTLPPISRTEREALEAGDVWWESELFRGNPDWTRLFELPESRLDARERAFLDHQVETLCAMLDDWDITHHRRDLPEEVWRYLKEEGFFGMIIPRRYGGLEFSARAHSEVVMKIATRSLTAAVTVMVPNSLGPAKLLLRYGTEAQKRHYLPRLARGEEIPCFALTGPEAGSDAASIPDRGVVCRGHWQGEPCLGIRLDWEKRYITLGPVATLIGLAFRLYDPDHLLGDEEDLGITLALVPTHLPGIEIGRRHLPLDIPFMNGPNRGRGVFIPLSQVIGERAGVGQGWRMLMECLADGRGISLPSLAVGAGKVAAHATGAYAAVRRQFHQPIGRFEGVREALARIAGHTWTMDAARRLTLTALDGGVHPTVVSAIVKYHLTERMRCVLNDAMDVHGGRAICLGPRNYLARAYQAIPISITVEGANILTRSLILFGQGALRCHPWLGRLMAAAADPDEARGLRAFDEALAGHVRHFLATQVRALWHAFTQGGFHEAPVEDHSAPWYGRFAALSARFAAIAELSLVVLGGSIKRREYLSGRLADALSELFLGTAALRRYQDDGRHHRDLPLLEWACRTSLARAERALLDYCDNFPVRPLGWLMRHLYFPFGARMRPPDDPLTDRVAALLLQENGARARLVTGIYLGRDERDPLYLLQQGLAAAGRAAPVLARIRHAMRDGALPPGEAEQQVDAALALGLVTEEERQAVQALQALRRRIIEVDAFTPEALGGICQWPETTRHAG